jgi:hypothetical protein
MLDILKKKKLFMIIIPFSIDNKYLIFSYKWKIVSEFQNLAADATGRMVNDNLVA